MGVNEVGSQLYWDGRQVLSRWKSEVENQWSKIYGSQG